MTAPLDFWFDFASPYGYLASTQIDDHRGAARAHGPVASDSARRGLQGQRHEARDGAAAAGRVSRPRRTAFRPPARRSADHAGQDAAATRWRPAGPIWWLEPSDPAKAHALAKAIYHAHWGEGRDVATPEQVAEVAAPLGISAADLIAGVREPLVKDRLRAETDEAIRRGVFGAPFIHGRWRAVLGGGPTRPDRPVAGARRLVSPPWRPATAKRQPAKPAHRYRMPLRFIPNLPLPKDWNSKQVEAVEPLHQVIVKAGLLGQRIDDRQI